MPREIPSPQGGGGGGGAVSSVNGQTGAVVLSDGNIAPLTGWVVPDAADFTVITESSPGIATLSGDNDGTGLPGVSMTVTPGSPNLACAVLALGAPLADGEAAYFDFDFSAVQYSFGACVVGVTAVKETSPSVWDGGNIQVFASHIADEYSTGTIQWTASGSTYTAHTGALPYTRVGRAPRFFRFRRVGPVLYPEVSTDGVSWLTGYDTQPLDAAITHIGLWVYNNATSFTFARIRAWKVE